MATRNGSSDGFIPAPNLSNIETILLDYRIFRVSNKRRQAELVSAVRDARAAVDQLDEAAGDDSDRPPAGQRLR
jgi:hypothetical protein